jgi:hypothetical protein
MIQRALAALDDDLDTPSALRAAAELAEMLREADHSGDRAALRLLLAMLGFRAGGAA